MHSENAVIAGFLRVLYIFHAYLRIVAFFGFCAAGNIISLTNEELEASLAYDLESSKFENSLYGENYSGKAYDIQEFVGEYTNKNGTTFLIAKDSRDYENNNETKSYVTGYKAYSVSDGLLHTIMVTNTLSLSDKANDLPNEIDMVSIDEFKEILDSFSTN